MIFFLCTGYIVVIEFIDRLAIDEYLAALYFHGHGNILVIFGLDDDLLVIPQLTAGSIPNFFSLGRSCSIDR